MVTLTDEAFTIKEKTAHTFIFNIVIGNDTAEYKVENIMNHQNDSIYCYTLQD